MSSIRYYGGQEEFQRFVDDGPRFGIFRDNSGLSIVTE